MKTYRDFSQNTLESLSLVQEIPSQGALEKGILSVFEHASGRLIPLVKLVE